MCNSPSICAAGRRCAKPHTAHLSHAAFAEPWRRRSRGSNEPVRSRTRESLDDRSSELSRCGDGNAAGDAAGGSVVQMGAGRSHHHHPFLSRPEATNGLIDPNTLGVAGIAEHKRKAYQIPLRFSGGVQETSWTNIDNSRRFARGCASCARAEAGDGGLEEVHAVRRTERLKETIDMECRQSRNPIFVGPAFLIRTRLSFATLDQDDERFPNCAEVTRGRRSNLTSVSSLRAWQALSSPPSLAGPPAFS